MTAGYGLVPEVPADLPTAGTPIDVALREAGRERRRDITLVGVLVFIASETMFFSGLFAVFFNAKANHAGQWPPPGTHLEIGLPLVLTAILLTSSVTMQLAIRRIRAGDRTGLVRALSVTLLLGIAFLAGQAIDYLGLGFSPASGPYGAAFFTLTGFHGAHVFAGVVLLLGMLIRASSGQFDAKRHAAIEGVGAYWHFVDLVWLLVLSSIYLLP